MSGHMPSLTPRTVTRILQRAGFILHHQKGSHAHYQHGVERTRWVTVPMHLGDLRKGVLHSIIHQSGLTAEEFLKLR
jgi:predicted RNA binding protein YcfA (HicA-like mRNA interferase family)